MKKYFNNQNLRILQKEKAFEIFYKTVFKQNPAKLYEELFTKEFNIYEPIFVDVTFDTYLKDNIDRIFNYEKYREESWIELI